MPGPYAIAIRVPDRLGVVLNIEIMVGVRIQVYWSNVEFCAIVEQLDEVRTEILADPKVKA